MPLDFISGLIEGLVDVIEEVAEVVFGNSDAAALAVELGTSVVAIGAGAAAIGACVALAELTVDTLRKFINSRDVSKKIEDALNNDEKTLKLLISKDQLAGAHVCRIGDMKKVVHSVKRTPDGQTVATVRITHPKSGACLDAHIAGNKVSGVYEGLVL